MPYDPNFPATGLELKSAGFRDQFHGIKDLIDAIPGITAVVVDSVSTLGPGEPASATLSIIGTVLHISLAIPRGADGIPGLQGEPGLVGPPFANAVIDSITTLNPGASATASVSFDGNTVHFNFGIPHGAQGEQGTQGAPGEVTNAALGDAIASAIEGTARNPGGVSPFGGSFSDPPTQAEMQAFAAWSETLRAALVR